jgi:predicted transcriptional regulator
MKNTIPVSIPLALWKRLHELAREMKKSDQEVALDAINLYIDIQQAFADTDRITLTTENPVERQPLDDKG